MKWITVLCLLALGACDLGQPTKMVVPAACKIFARQPMNQEPQPVVWEAVIDCMGGLPKEITANDVIWPTPPPKQASTAPPDATGTTDKTLAAPTPAPAKGGAK